MNAINASLSQCPSDLLQRFVRSMKDEQYIVADELTIAKVVVAVRQDRLIEETSWSFKELDAIEEECLQFAADAKLAQLFPAFMAVNI